MGTTQSANTAMDKETPCVRFTPIPAVARHQPTTELAVVVSPQTTRAQVEEEQRLRRQHHSPLNQTTQKAPPAPCPCGRMDTYMPGCPYVSVAASVPRAPANAPGTPSFLPVSITELLPPGVTSNAFTNVTNLRVATPATTNHSDRTAERCAIRCHWWAFRTTKR